MDPFIDLFLRIDDDGTGSITMNELKSYVEKHNMDTVMIEKWKNLFTTPESDDITMERFCEVLGLKPADIIEKRKEMNMHAGAPRSLGSDIKVIFENMSLDQQIDISDQTRTRLNDITKDEDMNMLTENLKDWLEKTYGGLWQAMIVDGAYWVTFSHIQENSFHFHLRNRSYLFWQTSK